MQSPLLSWIHFHYVYNLLKHTQQNAVNIKTYTQQQGFQLSRIERESPAWTLFLPLSRQVCKISHINEKNPAKHVKSPASVGKKTLENNYLVNFHRQGGMQPQKIIYMGISKQTWTWPQKINLISEIHFYSQVIANTCMVRDINFFTLSCISF